MAPATILKVYQYRMSIFENIMKVQEYKNRVYIELDKNFINTAESIKTELIRYRTMLPNPAVYNIETSLTLPVEETLLPVAKRTL